MAVGPEVPPYLLYLLLSLSIGLGVISEGEANWDAQEFEEGLPYARNELWPTIGDDIFRESIVTEDVVNQGEGVCIDILVYRSIGDGKLK